MFELDAFDADSFETGVWSTIQGDSELKIARAGNAAYIKERRRLEKEFRREHGEKLTPEQEQSLNCQAIARGLLKDWRNVTERGELVDYTPEIGARYLKRNPRLLGYVLDKANDLDQWEREEVEAQAGKPLTSSAGVTSGGKKASKTPTENTDK